ncbi:phosphatidylinositol kinase- protein kinase tor1 [Clydaea vesicula]|uniref:Serine/threonine-protein kinase TOR n=1 Tax=Clydaea vesicula TaxID=447962 RepID=A0AAD5U8J1_9FUNG|nr:phosphatidylinositol kinase- protein kinase tor1 [Clydaea vesicula]
MNQSDALNRIIADLKNKNDDSKIKAATELKEFVSTIYIEISVENFSKFINDLNRRIFELIHSSDNNDKIAGVLAIDKLIDFDGEENITKISRFANHLRIVLPSNDPQLSMYAARALGHLAIVGASQNSDFVEFEVRRCLEWLGGDRNEAKRFGSVLVLKELSISASTIVYTFIPQILDLIWIPLKDIKPFIREAAADALCACLGLINLKDSNMRKIWHRKIYEEISRSFKSSNSDTIHGALLALKQLLTLSNQVVDVRYSEISELILRHKDHKDGLVRRTVISLIPTLAAFDIDSFVQNHLSSSMSHLLNQLKKDRDRSSIFISIGKISIVLGNYISPFLDLILQNIKEGLSIKTSRNKTTAVNDSSILQCIRMLATAVGPALTKYMHELLDLMFYYGLNEQLHQVLIDLISYLPPLLPSIQDRLLHIISSILVSQAYRTPSSYPAFKEKNSKGDTVSVLFKLYKVNQAFDVRDVDSIILALNILGKFDFSGHNLNEIVRECTLPFFDDDNADIRKSAVSSCCELLIQDPICYQTNTEAMQIVGEIIERLITVAVADTDANIRRIVLQSLDGRFDHHLVQTENVRSLFIVLNDEVFGIREVAVEVIGRLSLYEPSSMMPSLRKLLIQLLTELEYSGITRQKEEAAKLLRLLVMKAQRLIKPYIDPILKVLIPKAKGASSNASVTAKILVCLGELSTIGGEDLLPYLNDLMPIILDNLQDQSSSTKREAALKVLGQLSNSTCWVVEPYLKYPNLLNLLIHILKTDLNLNIRKEAVKVMGILGAVDPYKHKIASRDSEEAAATQQNELLGVLMGIGPSHDDYYPTVSMVALMKILKDPSLQIHHSPTVQALMFIFKTLGIKCVQFLPQVMHPFLNMMRTCPSNVLESYFQQLGTLVSIVKLSIKSYLVDVFSLIKEFWNPTANIQITILSLIEAIAVALEEEFKIYLPMILPELLSIFETDVSEKKLQSQKALQVLVVIGGNLEEYLHLVVPVLVKLFEKNDVPFILKKVAIQSVGLLCKKIDFSDFASRIIHPIVRILGQPSSPSTNAAVVSSLTVVGAFASAPSGSASLPGHELKTVGMDTICSLIYQMGADFIVFVPMMNKVLTKYHLQHRTYEILIGKLLKNEALPQETSTVAVETTYNQETVESQALELKKLPVNQQHLKKAWENSQISVKEDWIEWMRRFSIELLKESPSQALRACSSLAQIHYPLTRELFNAGFVSCWSELYDQYQDELVRSLETALTSPSSPPEIQHALLVLAEFMEHDDKALPINIRTLSVYAAKCQSFAKALHYRELEFLSEPHPNTIDGLIIINHLLQQSDSAIGILNYAQKFLNIEMKENWYERLNRWEDGLAAYEKKQLEDPTSVSAIFGRMKCLNGLGEWEALSHLAKECWDTAKDSDKRLYAAYAAAGAWGVGDWDNLDKYISMFRVESTDSAFFRSILALDRNLFPQAKLFINKTRELVDAELVTLLNDSYSRAYLTVVRIQMLAELEEIIDYKTSYDHPEHQNAIRRTWVARLLGCQRSVEVWQRTLKVRAAVISPVEDKEMWIKFANLCRKNNRLGLSAKTLTTLLNTNSGDLFNLDLYNNEPVVVYAALKHLWASGGQESAFNQMKLFTKMMVDKMGLGSLNEISSQVESSRNDIEKLKSVKLLARCYLKVGTWQSEIQDDWNETSIPQVLRSYLAATQCDGEWYKAWHAWAFANFEVLNYYERKYQNTSPNILVSHLVSSVTGFFRSIALSKGNSLQDALRLLTLWFKYGYYEDVNIAIGEGFKSVSIDTWLQVIPQLIARIYTPRAHVRRLIHQLLADVGKEHPQALVYSVTVASKSQALTRKKAALSIMDNMRVHSTVLVEQALLVSQELIRVSILWTEMWHGGLEEASRQYFGANSIEGMFSVLEPLHQTLEKGPETLQEISFSQAYGASLQEALEWCKKYKRSLNLRDLAQAWDLYYQAIAKQLPFLTELDLSYVSPKLMSVSNLEVAVPGTYRSGDPVIKISSFEPILTVITSKQRPRKFTMKGSDGKDYQYLLKGHEDLRQGDTLHALIVEYREKRKIVINTESRLLFQMSVDYETKLTVLQKVEIFEHAMNNTDGQDLYKVLWLTSKSSETEEPHILEPLLYILGLGDRHLSNLMLARLTGKIIHIDFGDCFEVAMLRDKFPEKIPFRLTRMLVKAMEVSGIEGNYRITCENVMRVLRTNKDSLMAVLEAFIHDPLINWWKEGNAKQEGNATTDEIADDNDFSENNKFSKSLPASKIYTINTEETEELEEGRGEKPDVTNSRALTVINRVSNKLTGR